MASCKSFLYLSPGRMSAICDDSLRLSPVFAIVDLATRLFSPYEFNPFNINPLRDVLTATVDFEVLRTGECPINLFVSATNVRTGKIKVFERQEICADRVMASACLPTLFQAVDIGGEHYWDGGYMGNPAMFPLINTRYRSYPHQSVVSPRIAPDRSRDQQSRQ